MKYFTDPIQSSVNKSSNWNIYANETKCIKFPSRVRTQQFKYNFKLQLAQTRRNIYTGLESAFQLMMWYSFMSLRSCMLSTSMQYSLLDDRAYARNISHHFEKRFHSTRQEVDKSPCKVFLENIWGCESIWNIECESNNKNSESFVLIIPKPMLCDKFPDFFFASDSCSCKNMHSRNECRMEDS